MLYTSLKTIIVIEDDAVTRNLFLDCLQQEGFNAIGAENGCVGVELTKEYLPDLVICDLVMPEMDGYAVLSKLRQDPLTAIIPLIMLTANHNKAAIRKAMELGADDYLTKPSTVDELLKAIAIRLEKQAILRHWYATSHFTSEEYPLTNRKEDITSDSIFPPIPHLQKVFEFIEAYYHEGITLSDVAEAVGYSPAYLTNQVAKQTGETVNSWIVKRRMAAARPLLQNTNQTIEEIAAKLGYQNACHFSRQFRQHHGISPTSWRKQHQLTQVVRNPRLQFLKNQKELFVPTC
jgi:YesN/AraC family two-component response regulator